MRHPTNILRLFAEILAIVFGAEVVVMFLLPAIAPGVDGAVEALLDGSLLSLLAAPAIVWRLGVAMRRRTPHMDAARFVSSRRAVLAAAGVLVLGLLATVGVYTGANAEVQSKARAEFGDIAGRITREVERRANLSVYGLLGARGVYAASKSVERGEFAGYVASRDLPREFPGVIGMGFIERVQRKDLDAFIARERADVAPDFAVHGFPDAGALASAPDMYVVKHCYPAEANLKVWGLDLGSEPVRREAIERAIETGRPTTTGRIVLAQHERRHTGFLYLVPVFRNGVDHSTPEARRANLVGLAYCPIVLEHAMADVGGIAGLRADFEVYDGDSPRAESLLYDHDGCRTGLGGRSSNHEDRRFAASEVLQIGGRPWTIEVSSTPVFEAAAERSTPAIFGAAGIVTSLLAAGFVYSLMSARSRALAMARAMTADLAEAKEAAEAASRAKSAFLANMSHEIRTPLTAILGFTDILREDGELAKAPRNRVHSIETISNAGNHLLTVINDILDLSKIEAERMTVERIETPLAMLLHDTQEFLCPRAAGKGLTLSTRVLNPVPDTIVSDPTRLRQILMNLVGNAIKFTDKGSVTVLVSSIDAGGSERLVIDVEDTGHGITDAEASRLFKPFTQADETMSRRFGGTGLGLTICRRLAHMMGGDVTLERTAPGEGSRFRVVLPLVAAPGAAMFRELGEVVSRVHDTLPTGEPALSGRILLAEDGPDNQRLISHHLRKAGAEVDIADNGRIALDMIEKAMSQGRAYDLLVSDMQMPEVDGYTLASTLRTRDIDIRIVALTAHAMAEDRAKCLSAGCDDFATKPVNKNALLATCAKWLAAGKAGRFRSRSA
ncbi:MAG: CHASE domain-containing protein [Phycisphaerales bacterium]